MPGIEDEDDDDDVEGLAGKLYRKSVIVKIKWNFDQSEIFKIRQNFG